LRGTAPITQHYRKRSTPIPNKTIQSLKKTYIRKHIIIKKPTYIKEVGFLFYNNYLSFFKVA